MRVALEAHNVVLRETVAANDGTVFNYTGDGMCAVFASPRSAVDAAIAAQRALELPLRMGIATGEAELRGDDYFGTVLNRTARVMAAGHGGTRSNRSTWRGLACHPRAVVSSRRRILAIRQEPP
jgi:class 3 adenylate cyclase